MERWKAKAKKRNFPQISSPKVRTGGEEYYKAIKMAKGFVAFGGGEPKL